MFGSEMRSTFRICCSVPVGAFQSDSPRMISARASAFHSWDSARYSARKEAISSAVAPWLKRTTVGLVESVRDLSVERSGGPRYGFFEGYHWSLSVVFTRFGGLPF